MSHLIQVGDGLWCIQSHFTAWGCKGSVRMSVIGTQNGLVLYSPVALDAPMLAEIEALGRVDAIVAPNLYHHMFLRAAAAAFPRARVLVPAGLEAKIGVVPRAEVMTDTLMSSFAADLDHHIFAGHAIHETSLYHRPSATLVTADLIYNYHAEQFAAEKAFFQLVGIYGRPAVPFYHRFAIRDKTAVQRLIDKVRGWPLRRIVPCHGRIVERRDAGEVFAAAWSGFA